MKKQRTLKKLLKSDNGLILDYCYDCYDFYDFAKNLTLEQFLRTCPRGDWIICLFEQMNSNLLKEKVLATAHCVNIARELMVDTRSSKAVDVAIAFGEGKATREELDRVALNAKDVVSYCSYYNHVYRSHHAYAHAAAAAFHTTDYAKKGNASNAVYLAIHASSFCAIDNNNPILKAYQKLTADICRQYLPLEIWHISKL